MSVRLRSDRDTRLREFGRCAAPCSADSTSGEGHGENSIRPAASQISSSEGFPHEARIKMRSLFVEYSPIHTQVSDFHVA